MQALPGETYKNRILFSPHAVFTEKNPYFPQYYELIPVTHPGPYQIEITQKQYITRNITLPAEQLNQIPEEITVIHSVEKSGPNHFIKIEMIPAKKGKGAGQIQLLQAFKVYITPLQKTKATPKLKQFQFAANSMLSSGTWRKIKTSKSGIYKLTHEDLLQMGFSQPENVKIYGNGGAPLPIPNNVTAPDDLQQIPIWIEKGADNVFNNGDFILFYAEGPATWKYSSSYDMFEHRLHPYSDAIYYFLTTSGTQKSIASEASSSQPATHTVTSFTDYDYHEEDQANLLRSGIQWFEPIDLYPDNVFPFTFASLDNNSPVKIKTRVVARYSTTSTFTLEANGTPVTDIAVQGVDLNSLTEDFAATATNISSFSPSSGSISINIRYNTPSPSASAWLDYVVLNAKRHLTFNMSPLFFRAPETIGTGNVAEFRINNSTTELQVWDITHVNEVKHVEGTLNGSEYIIKVNTDTLRQFVAFEPDSDFPSPILEDTELGLVENQNLHGLTPSELVIVTHPDFLAQAEQLATLHRTHDPLTVSVVTTPQIFNEFSSGTPDVSAIRNFMRMLYQRSAVSSVKLKYLLLFGDGSFDNKNPHENNTNYILTYQSDNSLVFTESYVTDDFFGLLDENEGGASGLVDIGIGRLPVKSGEEATHVINKIDRYLSDNVRGSWQNSLCFIADDEDNNIHMRDANILTTYIDTTYPAFNIPKIYLDAYPQQLTSNGERYPDVNKAILERIQKGALIINYTGHGSENGLAEEKIISKNDIENWRNAEKLPLFITATCEFSRFDDVDRKANGEITATTSAGELVLLNPDGGGIALLTTTRLVYSSPNFTLNQNFYRYAFAKDANNEFYRLGDMVRLTKNNSGSSINKRNFSLLGDPALPLAIPKFKIITTHINETPVTENTDTLKALSKVTISGYLADDVNNKITSDGILYPILFDKATEKNTLQNNGTPVFHFLEQSNIIYKGKASINQGNFSFSFIIPKDINYAYGKGKISYYASAGQTDAHGAFKDVTIGGISDNAANDQKGPDIKLYLNDDQFVNGGITDKNPKIYALLNDSSGINTTGYGIGHDITAILDDDTQNPIILNDFYEANLDDYTGGKVDYPLTEMEPGDHKLILKAWDIFNNSAESTINFMVNDEKNLEITHVLNYPNPFTTRTSFYFEHNQPSRELQVLLQIFTISGQVVKTFHTTVLTDGYRVGPIEWDGLDDFGNKIGKGVYIYRLKVRSYTGQETEVFEKLYKL